MLRRAVMLRQSRLSVCLSVTFRYRDLIGWNYSKIISPLVSKHEMFALYRPQHYGSTPRGTPRNFGRNSGGVLEKRLLAYRSSLCRILIQYIIAGNGWLYRDIGVGIQRILQRYIKPNQVQGSSVCHQCGSRAAAAGHFRHHCWLDLEHSVGHDIRPTCR